LDSRREHDRCGLVPEVRFSHSGTGEPAPGSIGDEVQQGVLVRDGDDDEVVTGEEPRPEEVGVFVRERERCVRDLGGLEAGGNVGSDGDIQPVGYLHAYTVRRGKGFVNGQ
jgi:hypothetical protein